MNRYFLYLAFLNMVANVVSIVPSMLLKDRFNGSGMAIVLAVPIGVALSYIVVKSMEKFPRMDLPEILKSTVPNWVRFIILFVFGMVWFTAGLMILLVYGDISKVFINPDLSNLQIVCFFLALVIPVSLLKSDRILYMMEILFWINTPLIAFISVKSLFYQYMKWDAVWATGTTITKFPSIKLLSAASYIFVGSSNMIIFGRLFEKKIKKRAFAIIAVGGFFTLFTTFFIPIGLLGADGVGEYVYPWITSADSLRIELGFVERVIFPFLLLYASISFMSIIISWHVSLKLFPDIFSFTRRWRKFKKFSPWLMPSIFAVTAMYLGARLNEPLIFKLGSIFFTYRLGAEILLVLLLLYAAWRKKT